MGKSVMIPEEFFMILYRCFVENPIDKCKNCKGCDAVKAMLKEKKSKLHLHELYSKSKTASSDGTKHQYRMEYIRKKYNS